MHFVFWIKPLTPIQPTTPHLYMQTHTPTVHTHTHLIQKPLSLSPPLLPFSAFSQPFLPIYLTSLLLLFPFGLSLIPL